MIRLALERPGVFQAITEECNFGTSVKSILFSFDCSKLKPGSEQLLDYVTYHYSVQAEGRSRVISFGYSSLLPEVSFVLANALLVTYLEDQRGENARARESAVSWLLKEKKGNQGWQLKENFYHDLHKEMTDLETERRNVPNPARLVSLAEFPLRPSSPKRLRLLAAAFVITAFLAGLLTALNDLRGRGMNSLKASTSEPLFPAEATCEERDPPSEIPKSFGSSAPYDGRLRRMQPTGPAQPK